MKISIIVDDNAVIIDGEHYDEVDLSFIEPGVHAVQWDETSGEEEIKDDSGRIIENRPLTDISKYQKAIDNWGLCKQKAADDLAKSMEILSAHRASKTST